MTVPIVFMSLHPEVPKDGYWDYHFVELLAAAKLWGTADPVKFERYDTIDQVADKHDGIALVFPARHHHSAEDYAIINAGLARFKWAFVFAVNDEEGLFDSRKLSHPNIAMWQMTPRTDRPLHDKALPMGEGYPPDAHKMLAKYSEDAMERPLDWYFSGQVTTNRRKAMAEQLEKLDRFDVGKYVYNPTSGFTQGFGHDEYYRYFAQSKVAICPTGAVTPDTFRLYEALEAGCLPIADDISPVYDSQGFFDMLFGSVPFPIIRNYNDLPGYIDDSLELWPANANRTYAWWQQRKRNMAYNLRDTIRGLADDHTSTQRTNARDAITVIIPTSPIKSHPSTAIIEETIRSVRHHLPDSEIIITFDGVRPEQEDRRADYEEYIRRMLWLCNFTYKNTVPFIFDLHMHQTGMLNAVLSEVKTPLLLYMEADAPLVTDEPIDFVNSMRAILDGQTDVVRYHHEAVIPKEHKHMMHGGFGFEGMTYMRTSQWSQRPHLASVAFYRRVMDTCFTPHARSFIEDKMHGVVSNAYLAHGMGGWHQYRVAIYHPRGGNIKRSYHTDGRAGAAKYDDTQEF